MSKEKFEPDKKINLAGMLNQIGKPERERRVALSKPIKKEKEKVKTTGTVKLGSMLKGMVKIKKKDTG